MKDQLLSFLRAPEFDDCRVQINSENRLAIRLLAALGLPLSIINVIVQLLVTGPGMLPRTGWLTLYCVLLLVLERFILSEDATHTTLRLYLLQAPAILIVILLGSVWDPTHQGTTFLLFLMAMPVFVFDRPVRLTAVYALWSVVFLSLSHLFKSQDLFITDAVHVLEFYFTSMVVTEAAAISAAVEMSIGFLPAFRMSFIPGMRGSATSGETANTQGVGNSTTSTTSSSLRSAVIVVPFASIFTTPLTLGTPSAYASCTSTCWA